METARTALRERRRLLAERRDFTIETTLSGLGGLSFLQAAREHGYSVKLFYVGLPSARLCKIRVAERVRQGGHSVPQVDIERRYYRSLANLPKAISMANRTEIYDNSSTTLTLVARFVGSRPDLVVNPLPDWIAPALQGLLAP
jgi:predicted ABC-type ATPase